MQHAVEDDSENRKEDRRARHQVHIGMLVVPRPSRRALAIAQDGLLYDISFGVVGASVLILGRDGKEAGGRGGRQVEHFLFLRAPIRPTKYFAF